MRPSPRSAIAVLVLAAGILAAPLATAPPAAAVGPLPTCRFADILTVPRDYDSWRTTLVDWILSVGRGYKPPDLVELSDAGVTGGGQVRRVALDDLTAMARAARQDGTPLGNVSAYRSYREQVALFNYYVDGYGFKKATTFSARPGHSEHQLGLTIDFADSGSTDFVSETSGAGAWLAENAWKYGWLMSYPKGKKRVTCYSYEPWHYRYVGRDLAKEIHDSGLTIREYLWAHYTLVDPVTGEPIASASPAPTITPTEPPVSPGPSPTAGSTPGSPSPIPNETDPSSSAPPAEPIGIGGVDLQQVILGGGLVAGALLALLALGRRRGRGRA